MQSRIILEFSLVIYLLEDMPERHILFSYLLAAIPFLLFARYVFMKRRSTIIERRLGMRKGAFVTWDMRSGNVFAAKSSQLLNMRLAGFCYLCRELY